MVARRFVQQDVFAEEPLRGNPLAVVVDADGLTDEEMARLANWTNLSETTFLLAPTDPAADYRVRIFTTDGELPFAGHPTLGTCHAWLAHGGVPRSPGLGVQECGVGLVRVHLDGDLLAFEAPPLVRSDPLPDAEVAALCAAVGLDPAAVVAGSWVDNGPGWRALLLRSADDVLAAAPPAGPIKLGLVGPHPPGGPAALEVRAFFGDGAVAAEDPVTGSLNASVAQWLLGSGRIAAPYVAAQGTALGRAGRVHVSVADDHAVRVGGRVRSVIVGTVDL